MERQYGGIDLHRRRSMIMRMDEGGEMETVRVDNYPDRAMCQNDAGGESQALPLGLAVEVREHAAILDPALARTLPLL